MTVRELLAAADSRELTGWQALFVVEAEERQRAEQQAAARGG